MAYHLVLDIDPDADTFRGEIDIEIELEAPLEAGGPLQLHAEHLTLDSARLHVGEDAGHAATWALGPHGALVVTSALAVPPGSVTLSLTFHGALDEVPEGLYRVREADTWYVYTQFEPLAARRCFPCYDEPLYKAPFHVRLRVPDGCVALANSRVTGSTPLPDGRVEHTFTPTPPLATYLVAFAAGPFDLVDVPASPDTPAADDVPLRIVTTRGRGHLAGFAADCTPGILGALTRWFGQPYPYDKLDLVGVPNFAAGAMENVGLVTFRERLLLLDRHKAPANDRLWAQVVIAHELAHMWFGNLVTMRWWDDLWLNEAFATWMEMDCINTVDPALDAALEAVHEGLRVMDHDALVEARAIRQPIVDGGDVLNAFDGITYSKGAAVVRMTEAWLGAANFRDGVRRYLLAHAHGNAETADLLTALSHVSGQPVQATLVTFLDQPGIPLVDMRLERDAAGALFLHLSQRRYLPDAGVSIDTPPGWRPTDPAEAPPARLSIDTGGQERWHIPLTVRVGDAAGEIARIPHLLTERETSIRVNVSRTPTWLHPNADEAGYYRWNLPPDALGALLNTGFSHLSLPERVGLPEHLWALLEAGLLPLSSVLEALPIVAQEPHRLVLSGLCGLLRRLGRFADRPLWSRYMARVLGPHVQRIGALSRPGESDADRLLRPMLLTAVADAGAAPDVIAALSIATLSALEHPNEADPELLQYALPIHAWGASAAFRDTLVALLHSSPTPSHRSAALGALGAFGDPDVAQTAWDVFLTDALRAQDVFTLLRGASRRDETHFALWKWLDAHYDAVVQKIGDEAAANLPSLGSAFQDAAGRDTVEAFFAPAARRKPGAERNLRQTLEDIDRRVRLRTHLEQGLNLWLQANADAP